MKVNKLSIILFGLLAVCLTASAAESNRQTGRVNLQGFVMDSSCTINMQDQYQRIEIPQIAATELYQRGYSSAFSFAIRLENCLLSEDKTEIGNVGSLRMTFDGAVDSDGLFAVTGEAEGVGIQLSHADGAVITPGKPMTVNSPQVKDITLNYRLRLIADRASLKTGAYRTTVHFNLDYL